MAFSILLAVFLLRAVAQQPDETPSKALLARTPQAWAADANRNELAIIHSQKSVSLRYLQHKIDAKGDTVRDIIESKQGDVARLIQRNGHPITAAQDEAERDRLNADIDSPERFIKHQKRVLDTEQQAADLIRLLPQAMLYSYTPGQPQWKGAGATQVVIDFRPNPAFRPPTLAANLLTGLQGRVWIDVRSRCITRIQTEVMRPVDFGFGLIAKIFPGGTVVFEQTHVTADRWVYSRLEEHLTARVLMVKAVPQNASLISWDFQPISPQPSYQQAIHQLLKMQIPLQ